MTDPTHAVAQLMRLSAAFPSFKMAEPTRALYFEALQRLSAEQVEHSVSVSITHSRRFPTIAEFVERARQWRGKTLVAADPVWDAAEEIPVPGRKHVFAHNVVRDRTGRDRHIQCSLLAGEEYDEAELIGKDGIRRGLPNGILYRGQRAAHEHARRERQCCNERCDCRKPWPEGVTPPETERRFGNMGRAIRSALG